MNRDRVDKLARALLYEGYVLYPYRPSVKNTQRWTFGCVHPRSWNEAQNSCDPWLMRTECLVRREPENGSSPSVHVIIRFLHLLDRSIGQLDSPTSELPVSGEPAFEKVMSLDVGAQHFQAWQEAVEREVDLGEIVLGDDFICRSTGVPPVDSAENHRRDACATKEMKPVRNTVGSALADASSQPMDPRNASAKADPTARRTGVSPVFSPERHGRDAHDTQRSFVFPHSRALETVRADSGKIVAVLIREQQAIEGNIRVSWSRVADDLYRMAVEITDTTPLDSPDLATRDEALMRSFISTHTILGAQAGEFVSLTDPPEIAREAAALCKNVGTWPVLVGEGTEHDTLLSSPIILSDYPQLAPESPGDLFDSTEIDEILTLRILTLTEEEKRAAAGTDERVRQLLGALNRWREINSRVYMARFAGFAPPEWKQHYDDE